MPVDFRAYTDPGVLTVRPYRRGKVKLTCPQCGVEFERYHSQVNKNGLTFHNRFCQAKYYKLGQYKRSPETLTKLSESLKARKDNGLTGKKFGPRSPEVKERISQGVKQAWKEGKLTFVPEPWGDKERKHTPEFRARLSEAAKERWAAGWPAQPKVSKIELDLIPVLEPLGYRHTGDGSWWRHHNGVTRNPDFKKTGQPVVLEVFGDYWHRDDKGHEQKIVDWWVAAGFECIILWESEAKILLPAQNGQRG